MGTWYQREYFFFFFFFFLLVERPVIPFLPQEKTQREESCACCCSSRTAAQLAARTAGHTDRDSSPAVSCLPHFYSQATLRSLLPGVAQRTQRTGRTVTVRSGGNREQLGLGGKRTSRLDRSASNHRQKKRREVC